VFYDIPATLRNEIDELDSFVQQFLKGEIDAASLRTRRVPFGCYEQREQGKYMLRIRCPGGALTPAQLRTIAILSGQYGSDSIHITTRQEFQIHDLTLEHTVPVMRQLMDVGLATRGGGGNTVRNVLVSPEAGISPGEVFDPSPYVFALTSRLIAEPDSWALPRKFKIAFSNSGKDLAYAQFNDLGFIADKRQGELGFRVYVAGGMGAKPEVGHLLHEFIPTSDVYFVAEAAKRVFAKFGNRKDKNAARLRFLWKQLGEAHFRKLYEWELQQLHGEGVQPLELPQESSSAPARPFRPVQDDSPGFELWKRRYVMVQRQAGCCSIVVPVFLGNLKNRDAIALADFLEPFGKDVLRATLGQNLRLRNIPGEYLGNVYTAVKNISELASAPTLLANAIACTGADTCKLGICLSKGALRAVKDKLTTSGLDLDRIADFKLNISGCPNTCGQHMVADLGFFGKVGGNGERMFPAYGVVAGALVGEGGARLARALGQISAQALPEFVEEVLELWIRKEARFKSFAHYVDSEGAQDIAAICDRYRAKPDSAVNDTQLFDWGASKPFSLDGRGAGECSAGPTP
jgi:sulfite reductase (ferredoxin)